jgi:F0F1-type ATP synthase membrane subunit b/b'
MNNLKNNKFLVLFIGLIAFFILVFFTKNYYLEMTQNVLENETNIEKLESLNTKLDELNKLKKDLNDKNKEVTKTLKKFM